MKPILFCIFLFASCIGYTQQVAVPGVPIISVNPAAIDFDSTLVNQVSTAQTIVKNSGTGILTVTEIYSDNTIFQATPDSFSLIANQEQVVTVTFSPDKAESFYETLSIINNSPTSLVELICTGIGHWPLGTENQPGGANPFLLYPNPACDRLMIKPMQPIGNLVSIGIVDPSGNRKRCMHSVSMNQGTAPLDLSACIRDLASGIYLLQMQIGETRYTEKLVIIR